MPALGLGEESGRHHSVTVEYEANRRGSQCEPQEGSDERSLEGSLETFMFEGRRAQSLQTSCLSLHIRVHAAERAEL